MQISPSSRNRPIVRFDTADVAAQLLDGTLVDTQLMLEIVDIGNNWSNSGSPISVHRMTMGWAEGNGMHTGLPGSAQDDGTGEGATWYCAVDADIANNQADCGTQVWDHETPNSAELYPWADSPTATLTIDADQLGTVQWSVVDDVRAFLSGAAANHGWIMLGVPGEKLGHAQFATKEHTSGQAPALLLSFVPQPR